MYFWGCILFQTQLLKLRTYAGTTVHRRAPQSELTPLKPGGQAAGRTSPAPKGVTAVKSIIERVVNKADSRGTSSAGSRHAEEQV